MIRFFIPAYLLLFTLNFGAFSILEAVPNDLREESDTKRKRKKNRESREAKKNEIVSITQVAGLAPKGNAPQIQPNKNFRMTVDQIKSASFWIDRTVGNRLIKSGFSQISKWMTLFL